MFGISFGTKKSNTSQQEDMTKNVTTNQQQTGTNATSTTGSQDTSQTGTSQSQGQSNSTGSTQNTERQAGSSTQTSKNSQFSDQTFSQLDSQVQALLGGIGTGAGKTTSTGALTQMANFDLADFVNQTVASAASESQMQLDDSVGQLQSQIGGTAGTNSAAALLAGRLANNRAATLAGVQADATQKGQGILASQAQSGQQQQGVDNTLLGQLTEILKGGRAEATAAGTTAQQNTGAQTTQGSTTTSEAQRTSQNTNTQTVQDVLSQITQLLQGTEATVGASTTTGTKKDSGGGISLGF